MKFRQAEGYNWISMIAAFPNWMTDGKPWNVTTSGPDPYTVRSAWMEFGTGSAKNMDNEGGRPFEFPGRLKGFEQMFPDVDRLNPKYFQFIDRKIDYLNAHGFIPFIEASRRDASLVWSKFHKWPDSYARFIQYVWTRYQANNVVLSPVHLDIIRGSIRPPQYTEALNYLFEKWGKPPFGTLLSANAHPSTLENWGEDSWVTLHQIGNMREHNNYWYLTEIFQLPNPKPALNGEPYYSGYADPRHAVKRLRAPGNTPTDDRYVRSSMYGSFLSGGLAGHVYGAEGIWGADNEAAAPRQDVGLLSVELGHADAPPAEICDERGEALPGSGSECGPGDAQQEPRSHELRGVGVLRPDDRQGHLPRLLRKQVGRAVECSGSEDRRLLRCLLVQSAPGNVDEGRGRAGAVERGRDHRAAGPAFWRRLGPAAGVSGSGASLVAGDAAHLYDHDTDPDLAGEVGDRPQGAGEGGLVVRFGGCGVPRLRRGVVVVASLLYDRGSDGLASSRSSAAAPELFAPSKSLAVASQTTQSKSARSAMSAQIQSDLRRPADHRLTLRRPA